MIFKKKPIRFDVTIKVNFSRDGKTFYAYTIYDKITDHTFISQRAYYPKENAIEQAKKHCRLIAQGSIDSEQDTYKFSI